MLKSIFIALFFLLMTFKTQGQENRNRKKITAKRASKTPKIDGILNEDAWKNAPIAKDFIMMRPDNGKPEPQTHKTIVKLLYDDEAIYVGAFLYDNKPSSIPMEFTNRDNFGQSDFFLITINPNDDGQNPFEFIVMSTGAQADAKISNGREDFNWSAVWESAVSLTDKGWIAEMKIPYSALRFANRPVQSWGVNFIREIKSLNAKFTWNHIDNKKGTWTQYDGLVEGLKNIKPPTRLSLYPYASVTSISFDGTTSTDYSLGLDIKYGITENFTLDATLIPDFGQTPFDNITLNLGPFEQQYSEQRQFFTEGTELFNQGSLFYSRRIGDKASISYASLESSLQNDTAFTNHKKVNENIIDYPEKIQLLNAIKVSGRTKKGLGIGFFNAFTKKTSATIKKTTIDNSTGSDIITEETYKKTIEPFTNYNVLVLDQQFNQNSNITLINTNVTRKGNFRDGNTTGLLYHVETKDSKYNVDGSVKISNITENGHTVTGYSFDTSIGKGFGNWQGDIGYDFDDKNFDINDFGFQYYSNTQTIYGNISYQILKPTKHFNRISFNTFYNFNYLHKPSIYTGNSIGIHSYFQTKKRFSFGGGFYGNLGKEYDYYEPRQGVTSGVFYTTSSKINVNHWGSSDYRKKFAFDYRISKSWYFDEPKNSYGFRFAPKYRFSNQFSLSYGFSFNKTDNDRGYITKVGNDIFFGQRDRKSYSNTVSGKYSFSIKSSLSLTFRHNWEAVQYDNHYFTLNNNGFLTPNNTFSGTDDINFNSWNLDLNYIWEFAPGSQLIAFYRNSLYNYNTNAHLNFFKNIDQLFNQPAEHIFSLRLVYYIDYNRLKNIF